MYRHMPWSVSYNYNNITNSETHSTSTVFTMTDWDWNKQCLLSGVSALSIVACWRDAKQVLHLLLWLTESGTLIYIAINWVECLHIATCWRHTQHKQCCIHWKWSKQYLLLLLSGVSALSIAACWRDMQHKHCIYCHDHWRSRLMTLLDHLQVSFK